MGECACIYDGDGDGPQFSADSIVRARKPHRCCECKETIAPGQQYERTAGVWDGRFDTFKTCLPCVEIRGHLFCEGWTYGHVWERIREHFAEGGRPFSCIEELETVAAKDKLAAAYREYLELES